MVSDVVGLSYSDTQTLQAIRDIYDQYKYIADPHGAIAYLGLKDYLEQSTNTVGVFLETAHPSKFKNTIDSALDLDTIIHERLQAISQLESNKIPLSRNYPELFQFLVDSYAQ